MFLNKALIIHIPDDNWQLQADWWHHTVGPRAVGQFLLTVDQIEKLSCFHPTHHMRFLMFRFSLGCCNIYVISFFLFLSGVIMCYDLC